MRQNNTSSYVKIAQLCVVKTERAGRWMPLHTETSLRQLYSHARSHINGSCLHLPRLLTISRFSASRLDDGAVLIVAASILNRSGMIPFAVFYLSFVFSHSRQDNPRLRRYYQYARHRQNFRPIESRDRFNLYSVKKKSKKPNRFYNYILFRCRFLSRNDFSPTKSHLYNTNAKQAGEKRPEMRSRVTHEGGANVANCR